MLYNILKALGSIIFWILGLKSEGLQNLPSKGPVIVAANHVSNWDPIIVALVLPRTVHFMAKEALFKYSISDRFFRGLNAFPVKKGVPDRQAIRRALQVLNDGHVLGIFPEGVRNNTGNMKAQSGAAMIAVKSGAPIIPIGCLGTRKTIPCGWFKPLTVRVGEPMDLQEFQGQKSYSANLDKISADLMDKINDLLNK